MGGRSPNSSENQFIVEGRKKTLWDIRLPLPLSASLYLSFSISLSPHSCYTTLQGPRGSDGLQCPPRSSAEVILLGSGWGHQGSHGRAADRCPALAFNCLCVCNCVCLSVCVRVCRTQMYMQAPMCTKHRPHARHSYQGIPFGP